MIYTQHEQLGVNVSRLGFGCMRFPTQEDGRIDRQRSMEMMELAYKSGVNYFDTAYSYHDGESETFIREALAPYPRDSYYLADKLPTWLLKTEADPLPLLEEQLARCGVDYFDFYLIHALDETRWERAQSTRCYEQLAEQKKAGKIRNLGFSYHGDLKTFCEIIDSCQWDFVQIQMNYLDDVMMDGKSYYDKLCSKGIPCIVMEPVRGGGLSAPPDNIRKELEPCGPGSPASFALRWCMEKDNMPVILSGMSTLEQVQDNLDTFERHIPLTPVQKAAIDRTRDAFLAVDTVPCTGCNYCKVCPSKVEIGGVFRAFNTLQLFGNPTIAKNQLAFLGGRDASLCTQCGACSPMCPQHIDIPARLAQVGEVLAAL